ncbi:MAG: hypothetical protein RBS33_04615 [Lentimicrobium sp.]|nr:hypothetical protein [Lentimicrobiaceae bacterium]MDY0025247.1 hypothetical protein [Lentimicrobium sp.]
MARLNDFTRFANALLPHEVTYLLSINQFKDAENLAILKLIHHNTHHPEQKFPYKLSIDKRKYSNLKKWILERLEAIDVDVFYAWLLGIDHKIMTDAILPREEDALIKLIRNFDKPGYYFIRLYEIIRNYRFYLLIRFRHQHNQVVDQFLNDHLKLYNRCMEVNRKLHEATIDIVNQYTRNNTGSRKWERWMRSVFYDNDLDGLNRYLAIVRLTLIHFNYKEYDKLNSLYNDLDVMMAKGEFYSRRILINYYANRVMLHSKQNEHDKAVEYGYLSLRQHSGDYLHYVNNLCAVLLRQKRITHALKLMQESFPELKQTRSHHNRVGFAAFYIRALNMNNRAGEAADYAETFLNAYKDQIFEYRWHTFFASYLQSLFALQKYAKVLQLMRRYHLFEREQQYQLRAVYVPTIAWYLAVAAYIECEINLEKTLSLIQESGRPLLTDPHKCILMREQAKELNNHLPEIFAPDGTISGLDCETDDDFV